MQKITMLQRLAQKNTLFNSMYQKAKNNDFITHSYTFFYNLFYKKPKKILTPQLMQQSSDLVKRIYNKMGNDYSKKMYANRLLYNMTGDVQYMQNVIEMTKEGVLFLQQLRTAQNAGKKIFIFGTDFWEDIVFNIFYNVNFYAFIDNNSKEKTHKNLPVLTFEEYLQQKDNSVVILATRYKEWYVKLKENNINDDCIINSGVLNEAMAKRQYFDLPELRSVEKEHEIFVDCGCYDGETSTMFAQWHGNKKGTVYAFESDPQNIVRSRKKFEEIKKYYTGGGMPLICFR